jgi:hypothetical protein
MRKQRRNGEAGLGRNRRGFMTRVEWCQIYWRLSRIYAMAAHQISTSQLAD